MNSIPIQINPSWEENYRS